MNARTIRSTSAAMSWADGNDSDGCVSTCCGLASGDASVRTLIEVASPQHGRRPAGVRRYSCSSILATSTVLTKYTVDR